jgi:predicted dehydrogenase
MAGAYADAAAMLETARQCGRKLSIQLSTLFSKNTKGARRLIEEGRLGRIYHARSVGHRRRGRPFVDGYGTKFFVQKPVSGGGALFDMGVYHIAQILWLLGRPAVERVSGRVYQETPLDPARAKESGYSVEELGLGFARLAGGVTMDIIEAWAVHMGPFEGSSLFGSAGGLRLEPLSYHTTIGDTPADSTFDLEGADYRLHRLHPEEEAYDSAQHHWVAALQGRCELLPTAEIALQTMLISEGIYLSDRLGREVSAEEIVQNSKSTALKV